MCFTLLGVVKCNLLKCRLCYLRKTNCLNRNFMRRAVVNVDKREIRVNRKFSAMASIFTGNIDRFSGVTVDSSVENCTKEDFSQKLQESLRLWTRDNKRGIWFKVALEHADWVPTLAKNGFDYHHARNGSVTMYKWLPKDETNNIPPYCHTMIGVGAVVVNDKSEILVVREKYWLQPHWKLPGGYVEPGENLIDAAIREVYEETHINTEFKSVLNLRHAHNGMFGCSDIYIVVSLKPLSTDIEKCDREITDCQWMNIEEYLNHPNIHELNRFFVHSFVEYQKHNFKIDCKHGIHQVLKKPYTVYFGTQENT